jgi:hypothetical protein
MFHKKSTNGGTSWSGSQNLTSNPGYSIELAMAADSNNHIHVVCCDNTPGNDEIYYRRSTDVGVTWTTKRLTWNPFSSAKPDIAIDSSSHIHLVWQDNTPGNYEIYYKRGIQ